MGGVIEPPKLNVGLGENAEVGPGGTSGHWHSDWHVALCRPPL